MGKQVKYLTDEHFKIAESNGIKRTDASQRFYTNNWSLEDAITKGYERKELIAKNAKIWGKWKDLADKHNITREIFFSRVKLGWTEEDSATRKMGIRGENKNAIFSKREMELAKSNGLDKNYMATVRGRLDRGWERHRALTEAVKVPEGQEQRRRRMKRESSERIKKKAVEAQRNKYRKKLVERLKGLNIELMNPEIMSIDNLEELYYSHEEFKKPNVKDMTVEQIAERRLEILAEIDDNMTMLCEKCCNHINHSLTRKTTCVCKASKRNRALGKELLTLVRKKRVEPLIGGVGALRDLKADKYVELRLDGISDKKMREFLGVDIMEFNEHKKQNNFPID